MAASRVVAGFLGALLIWSVFAKAIDGRETQRTLTYALAFVVDSPGNLAPWGTRGLIVVEAGIAAALLLGRDRSRFALAGGLFAAFSAFVTFLLVADAPVSCGCGLGGGKQVDTLALIRSGGLMALSAIGWWLARRVGTGPNVDSPGHSQERIEP